MAGAFQLNNFCRGVWVPAFAGTTSGAAFANPPHFDLLVNFFTATTEKSSVSMASMILGFLGIELLPGWA